MPWRDIREVWDSSNLPKKHRDQIFAAMKREVKARFYADENFPPLAVDVLREYGGKVTTARDVGLLGHSDEDHSAYALRHGYVLITRDRDYLNHERFPLIHSPAIFVFDFGGGSREEIQLAYRCLVTVLSAPEFFDKWSKVDANRESWTELNRHQDGSVSRSRNRVHLGRLETWVDEPGPL